MHLRKVTIWATGLLLLLTFIVPTAIYGDGLLRHGPHLPWAEFCLAVFWFWALSGSPLIVSCFVAQKLKGGVPSVILLLSTLGYAVLYAFALLQLQFADTAWWQWIFGKEHIMVPFMMLVGMVSMPMMLPAWIVAWYLNSCFVKNDREPEVRYSATSG